MSDLAKMAASMVCQLALLGACTTAPGLPGNQQTPTPQPTSAPTLRATASVAPTQPTAPATPRNGGAIPIDVPGFTPVLLPGDDALWGIEEQSGKRAIFRVDPATNAVETVVEGLPRLPNPIHGMAVNGSIWITSWDKSAFIEYDAATGEERAEYKVGLHPIEPIYAFGDVWSLDHDGNSVTRLDTEAKALAATIDLGPTAEPLSAGAGGGLFWVVGLSDVIWGIDPATNTVARTVDTNINCLVAVAYVAERLLVASCQEPGVAQFDAQSGEALGPLAAPIIPTEPLEVGGRVWLPRGAEGDYVEALVALDAQTLEVVDEYSLPGRFSAGGYTVAFGSYWITGQEGAVRIPAEALSAIR